MTIEEFRTFKRSLARDVVKFQRGKITSEELYEAMYVALGKETIEETEQLLDEAQRKSSKI